LEIKHFLRVRGIHPVGGHPGRIVVRVALQSDGQPADQTHRARHARGDVALAQPMRFVAADEQGLAGHLGGGGGDERPGHVAHVDGVDPVIDG